MSLCEGDRVGDAGQGYLLTAGSYTAEVTQLGATLRRLTHEDVDLVAGWPDGQECPDFRGWVLMPWPNRVAGAVWSHAGRIHRLPVNDPESGSALHGLVGGLIWEAVEQAPASVRLRCLLLPQAGYPFRLELEVGYALDEGGLRVDLAATNIGEQAAPYGVGHHPYLTVGRRVDDCVLTVPAESVTAMDDAGRPGAVMPVAGTPFDFRSARKVGPTVLDHAFTGLLRDGPTAVATVQDPLSGREVRLHVGDGFGWLQVFSADTLDASAARESLAVEPMSCPPDAFNNATDLDLLFPGASHRAWFRIDAGAPSGDA